MRGARIAVVAAVLGFALSAGQAAELSLKAPAWLPVAPAVGAIDYPNIKGNDTSGIMVWTPDNELVARAAADEWCARWDKYARMSSVQRQYGGVIAFNCLWSPTIGRYILPEARLRGDPPRRRPAREPAVGTISVE